MLVVVVRSFGGCLLGVTCGRLSGCYFEAARRGLHALEQGADTAIREVPGSLESGAPVFGLGAGDTEIWPAFIPADEATVILRCLLKELDFRAFVNESDKPLPRMQVSFQ